MFDVYESNEEIGVFKLIEIWDCSRQWFEDVSLLSTKFVLKSVADARSGADEETLLRSVMGEKPAFVDTTELVQPPKYTMTIELMPFSPDRVPDPAWRR